MFLRLSSKLHAQWLSEWLSFYALFMLIVMTSRTYVSIGSMHTSCTFFHVFRKCWIFQDKTQLYKCYPGHAHSYDNFTFLMPQVNVFMYLIYFWDLDKYVFPLRLISLNFTVFITSSTSWMLDSVVVSFLFFYWEFCRLRRWRCEP